MPILGLDIGGANLKAATSDGQAAAVAFPLWKSPDKLTEELRALTKLVSDCDRIAVTMTGELADCFATKAEGVARILDSVSEMASRKPVGVWATSGRFLMPTDATANWQEIAAANWHALATWAGQFAPRGDGLLIDIGSTTTDLIPLRDGVPIPTGRTDVDRLLHGELLYTGVRRTPVCAVTPSVTLRSRPCPVAGELFATMLDVYLLTGDIAPDEADGNTADGRPAAVVHAENRLAHMLCCDRTELTDDELRSLAAEVAAKHFHQIRSAVSAIIERCWRDSEPATVILSGSGTFLAGDVLKDLPHGKEVSAVELSQPLSPALSESACAYAVACLADNSLDRFTRNR